MYVVCSTPSKLHITDETGHYSQPHLTMVIFTALANKLEITAQQLKHLCILLRIIEEAFW